MANWNVLIATLMLLLIKSLISSRQPDYTCFFLNYSDIQFFR
jgi:hypothetical protein